MKNENKKDISTPFRKVSVVCSRIAIVICLGFIAYEFFSNKTVEPIWIILLLSNIAIMNANRSMNKSKK